MNRRLEGMRAAITVVWPVGKQIQWGIGKEEAQDRYDGVQSNRSEWVLPHPEVTACKKPPRITWTDVAEDGHLDR